VKKKFVILAVATGLLLTGCGKSNEAASLGDTIITTAQLQKTVDSIIAERAKVDTTQMQLETGANLNRGQLRFKVLMIVFDEIAKDLDIKVTNSELLQKRNDLIAQVGGEDKLSENLFNATIAPEDFDLYIRAIVITSKLSDALIAAGTPETEAQNRISQLLSAKAKELKVSINPRYGVWDDQTGDIVAADVTKGAVTSK